MERARGGSLILVLAAMAACSGGAVGPKDCDLVLVEKWADLDGDGFGAGEPENVCPTAEGYSSSPMDCDDVDPEVNPDADEICNERDDDCDGQLDDGLGGQIFYADSDFDGFGARFPARFTCLDPGDGWVKNVGDCDDGSADVSPEGVEICNGGIDDDCNTRSDDNDPGLDPDSRPRWYLDDDLDGYGNPNRTLDRCVPLTGYVADDTDCDDRDELVSPAAAEVAGDGIDANCDTIESCYVDMDGDGARTDAVTDVSDIACADPPNAPSWFPLDCDDTNPALSVTVGWYEDDDNDGYGAGAPLVVSCMDPGGGLVPETEVLDCDDRDPLHHPGVSEICDDVIDQDCDLDVDCDDSDCDSSCLLPCADEVLDPIAPQVVNGNTTNSGDDTEPPCAFAMGAPEIAYQWEVPATGNYVVDTYGSNYDTTLYVYDGCQGATLLGCNDDSMGILQSEVAFQAQAGQMILIIVDGYSNAAGAFTLHIN